MLRLEAGVMKMNRQRKKILVDVKKKSVTRTSSGQVKSTWVDDEPTTIAIYDQSANNQLTYGSNGARIKQYDAIGLSVRKDFIADHFKFYESDGTVYSIKAVNNEGRLSQLYLEVMKNG